MERMSSMKLADKAGFEKANVFGTGVPNAAFAQYFTSDSFLNPSRIRRMSG